MRTGLLCAALLLITSTAIYADELYISPAGNDAWSGTLPDPNPQKSDGPLATLDAARRKARDIRKQAGEHPIQIAVYLRGGTYFLSEPVAFDSDDFGLPGSNTRFEAYEEEHPILSGGVQLRGFQEQPNGRWTLKIDDIANGKWNFSQLLVDGHRRMRPRLPKQGYYHIAGRVPPPAGDPKNPKQCDDRFIYSGDDIHADWKNRGDVEVISFHPWFTSMLRIADVDAAKKTVVFTGHTRTNAGYGQLSKGMRFLVENVGEALSEAGEWYLDRSSGTLSYIPWWWESPEKTVVIAPRLPQLMVFKGIPKSSSPHGSIVFRNIAFAHSNWTTPADGSSIAQAAVTIGGMVTATDVRELSFINCKFQRGGTYGLEIGAGCRDVVVSNCIFEDLGAGGVKVGTMALPAEGQRTERISISNNQMAHLGRIHPAAVGVWIGQAADVAVCNNDIYDLYYTCISSGWVWGYGKTANSKIRILDNHLHHYGQGVLSDMGAIYTLGASPDSLIGGNRIHDCLRDKYGGWGIYYDEGSSGWTSRNNLLYRLHDGGFHQHYGAENIYENNVLIDATEVQWGPSRIDTPSTPGKVVDRTAITFRKNIISGWGAPSVVRNETMSKLIQGHTDKLVVDHNLYWNNGKEVKFGTISFEEWQKRGLDKDSIIADPKLPNDPDDLNFRVPRDSPALKLGFAPFDVDQAGSHPHPNPEMDPKRWPVWFPPANSP
jgi:hypothetical protein